MPVSESLTIRKKRKRKKRRAIRRIIYMAGLMAVIVIALRTASNRLLSQNVTEQEKSIHHLQAASSTSVKPPVERHSSQIANDLKALSSSSRFAAQIYEHRNEYPETLLSAYLNNPEMEEFTAGYLEAQASNFTTNEIAELTSEELAQNFPLLLQWDKRWGYQPYGGSIIGLSGCGPTCLSMVLISLTGQNNMTPAQVAQFSETNGYYVEGSGTAWSLMTEGASQLGLSARELSLDEYVMKAALDAGQPIICSMGAGDFTTQGHFIMIYGYNEDGFLINDPNCIARSCQSWDFDTLRGQIKNLWAYAH